MTKRNSETLISKNSNYQRTFILFICLILSFPFVLPAIINNSLLKSSYVIILILIYGIIGFFLYLNIFDWDLWVREKGLCFRSFLREPVEIPQDQLNFKSLGILSYTFGFYVVKIKKMNLLVKLDILPAFKAFLMTEKELEAKVNKRINEKIRNHHNSEHDIAY